MTCVGKTTPKPVRVEKIHAAHRRLFENLHTPLQIPGVQYTSFSHQQRLQWNLPFGQQSCNIVKSLRTLQLTQKPQKATTRKRGKKAFYTNTIYFQHYIFISQVFHSPGHLLRLWCNNCALTDCMGCSFIPWLLTLFFQCFWFGFFFSQRWKKSALGLFYEVATNSAPIHSTPSAAL